MVRQKSRQKPKRKKTTRRKRAMPQKKYRRRARKKKWYENKYVAGGLVALGAGMIAPRFGMNPQLGGLAMGIATANPAIVGYEGAKLIMGEGMLEGVGIGDGQGWL
jgi:hypothetical protein